MGCSCDKVNFLIVIWDQRLANSGYRFTQRFVDKKKIESRHTVSVVETSPILPSMLWHKKFVHIHQRVTENDVMVCGCKKKSLDSGDTMMLINCSAGHSTRLSENVFLKGREIGTL